MDYTISVEHVGSLDAYQMAPIILIDGCFCSSILLLIEKLYRTRYEVGTVESMRY